MDVSVWNGILTILVAVIGAGLGWLRAELKALDVRDRTLAEREAAFETKVATEFITVAEFNRKGDLLRHELGEMSKKIDALQKGKL